MAISYLHSCIKPLTKWMKDGAAFIQLEGGRVFTEVLGNGIVERVQLLDEAFHIGQFGLGPLTNNKKDPDCRTCLWDTLEEGGRKPLPSQRSPFLAGSRADCRSATSASRSSWLRYKSPRWPPLCKSCKRATITAATVTLRSQHNIWGNFE